MNIVVVVVIVTKCDVPSCDLRKKNEQILLYQ